MKMQRTVSRFLGAVAAISGLLVSAVWEGTSVRLAAAEPPSASPYAFSLPDVEGGTLELSAETATEFTVVAFLGVECPLSKLYSSRLQALSVEFADRGVRVIGVGSNLQDSADELHEFAEEHALTFPIGKDAGNTVADRYGAERICEVVLLDRKLSAIYRGRIDDEYEPGLVRAGARSDDLRRALTQALAGEPIAVPRTEAFGCLIGREPNAERSSEATYAEDVAPILTKHCVECHQPGEIGPFSLTDYDEIVGWGPTLIETVDDGRMPPWHAEPGEVRIANERVMTDAEREILRVWVRGGMPPGDVSKLPKPAATKPTTAAAPTPDFVVPMADRPFRVPATGTVEYQYFVVDSGLKHDAWVVDAQVVPGNRAVVHHCIVFVRPPDGAEAEGIGWLSAYVPGQRAMPYPAGYGRRIPAGSKLVFQMHYTPNGTPQEDLTRIELRFADDDSITHEMFTVAAIRSDFEIPPHAADHSIVATRERLPRKGQLLAVAPHMHVRGKSFDLFAETGDARRKLLGVPRYDFDWQHVYAFEEPIPLANVDRLVADLRFDNSENNPANPDPSSYVYWGDQTYEEMAIAFYEIAVPRRTAEDGAVATLAGPGDSKAGDDEAAKRFAKAYFERFDADGDGRIVPEELPDTVANFEFWKLDADGNRELTVGEIEEAHRRRSAR